MVNILIIDDEESIRFSFQRFLAAEGHNVITAQGYGEALARMDETRFDLMLADIVLDDGWGIDILAEVMRRNLKTGVIVMTAYPTMETIRASFSMHAVEYLTKPLKQAGLLYSVNKVLQQMESCTEEGFDHVGKSCPIVFDFFSTPDVTPGSCEDFRRGRSAPDTHISFKGRRVIRRKGDIMQKTLKNKDIERILAEADDLLKQTAPEIIEYMEEERRLQLEEHAQKLKKLKAAVQGRIEKEKTPESGSYGEGMHEAIEDISKAMKNLASHLF